MKGIVIIAVLVGVALAADPPRPVLPTIFESRVYVDIRDNGNITNTTYQADGWYAVDESAGKALEDYRFPGNERHNVFLLQRYDIGAVYDVDDFDVCQRRSVNGSIPNPWSWIPASTYKGRENFGGLQVDVWELTIGYASVSVGVSTHNTHVPVFISRRSPQQDVFIYFRQFDIRTPNENLFIPPRFCPSTNVETPKFAEDTAGCVNRADMIARAQAWVNAKVPYNQGGYYQGYREDCSGYVSMAWELKSSLTTQTLPTVSHQIAKADLQPGDVLLDTAEHVVLFGGWTSGQTEYMAYEETRPGEGTVKRPTPYPYWYNQAAFIPYRFNSVC